MSSSMTEKTDSSGGISGSPPATTLDEFLGGRILVSQLKAGHRAGSDAVWLQAAVAAREGDRVLDLGAGVGVAGLSLAARIPHLNVTAIEIDAGLCRLAAANAARNGLAARFRVVNADVTASAETLFAEGLEREGYDQLMANPPYHREGTVRAAPDRARAAAHVMPEGALGAWIRCLATMAAPKGRVTLIHRPEALPELLPLLERGFGAILVLPLFAKAGEPATRIIVQARKGSRAGLSLLPGLVLHEADGRYTAKAEAVLRRGDALEL